MLLLEWIVGFIVLAVILWAFSSNRIEKYRKAREIKNQILGDQKKWQEKNLLSYGQIQDRKFALSKYVNDAIPEDTPEKRQLLNLINDWAELQVRSFQDRRSWVRKPPQQNK